MATNRAMCAALCPKRHNRLTLILLTLILLTLTARATQTNQIMPATLLTSLREARHSAATKQSSHSFNVFAKSQRTARRRSNPALLQMSSLAISTASAWHNEKT